LLDTLQNRGFELAVASNKYQDATEKMVAHFFPAISFVSILGQREGIPPKPDPSIVNEIMAKVGADKEETLYIGDSGVDMETVRNSGVIGAGVTWGFRPRKELERFAPRYIIDSAEEVLNLI
jgi:phosphoglycolate phosphatase